MGKIYFIIQIIEVLLPRISKKWNYKNIIITQLLNEHEKN